MAQNIQKYLVGIRVPEKNVRMIATDKVKVGDERALLATLIATGTNRLLNEDLTLAEMKAIRAQVQAAKTRLKEIGTTKKGIRAVEQLLGPAVAQQQQVRKMKGLQVGEEVIYSFDLALEQ